MCSHQPLQEGQKRANFLFYFNSLQFNFNTSNSAPDELKLLWKFSPTLAILRLYYLCLCHIPCFPVPNFVFFLGANFGFRTSNFPSRTPWQLGHKMIKGILLNVSSAVAQSCILTPSWSPQTPKSTMFVHQLQKQMKYNLTNSCYST